MERDSQQSIDNDFAPQDDNTIYLDIVGGVNKKGRVYGLGSGSLSYFASSSNSAIPEGISTSQYENLTSTISALNIELQEKDKEIADLRQSFKSLEDTVRGLIQRVDPGTASSSQPAPPFPEDDLTHDQDNFDEDDPDANF